MSDTLYVVIPCYNEEEVLRETAKRLREKLEMIRGGDYLGQKSYRLCK